MASEYEKKRLLNIKRNQEALAEIGLDFNVIKTQVDSTPKAVKRIYNPNKKRKPSYSKKVKIPIKRRKSRRLRGTQPATAEDEENQEEEAVESEEEFIEEILTGEEYWKRRGIEPKYVSDGKYKGWVNEKLRLKLGIADDSATAWNSNGGGKFSFKNPTGGKATSTSAKETARKMLHKNPNTYFYRHCAPGVEQWQGDWTDEEHNLFLETAQQYGCGNKWGLFATHIPHRVGYQCSQYYRHNMIATGEIVDPSFVISSDGTPHYQKKGKQ